jgi:multiple sugar transport system permease protein
MERHERNTGLFFVLPGILFFGIFSLYPLLNSFWISLFEYDMLSTKKWVGFENYITIFNDKIFIDSLFNTLEFVIGTYVPIIILSILFAVLLNSKIRLKTYYRILFFLPVITSEVIAAVVWLLMYNPDGPINNLLAFFGLDGVNWLNDSKYSMFAIILLTIWYKLGYFIVLFLSGLQGVPAELYEAAEVDGAGAWRKFWSITLPLLKPTLAFATTIALIQGVTIFIPSMLLTEGGPGTSTTVISLLIYQTGFTYLEMGKASAMSVVLFIGVMIATVIQLRLVFKEDD